MIPFINKEPAIVGAAVVAVLNALVLLSVIHLDDKAIAGINIALVAVLGLFVRQSVTPISEPTLKAGTTVKVEGTDTTSTV